MSLDSQKFVEEFFEKYTPLVSKVARKYLIPNRYNIEDVRQYIAERILKIMQSREGKENGIENPEKYFKSCLDFYCIEYQRMHGFIFDLPKRPRKNCEKDEADARSKGFKYLKDMAVEEFNSLLDYSFDSTLEENIPVSAETSIWTALTGLLSVEEAKVVECKHLMNMTWTETAQHLNVPQSTCWFRMKKAQTNIFNALDSMPGNMKENIVKILRHDVDTINNLYQVVFGEDYDGKIKPRPEKD